MISMLDVRHYCLQTMGITPWLLRTSTQTSVVTVLKASSKQFNNNSTSEKTLWQNILKSVGLSEKDVRVMEVCLDTNTACDLVLDPRQTHGLWVLGSRVKSWLFHHADVNASHPLHYQEIPVIVGEDLQDMLAHPKRKQRMYRALFPA